VTLTSVCIHNVGYYYYYYYYYYYPIVTRSFIVFTEIKESEKNYYFENYCSFYSAVLSVLKDKHTNRHDETEIF